MLIRDVIQYLGTIAPMEWQENYDNTGLIVGDENGNCSGIMVCLDSTEAVIEEAISLKCNLVVAHHPIIFSGLKKINGHHYVEKAIMKAIKHDVAIFAIHTNLDNAYWNGVNARIAQQLQVREVQILSPKTGTGVPDYTIGAGMIGTLENSMPVLDFLDYVKEKMELKVLKHTRLIKNEVQKIAWCGGSGSFLINKAIYSGADVYITSDIKYHEFFEANDEIIVLDIGHYESEKYTIDLLFDILQKKFTTFAVHFTKHITNPVNYF